MRRSYIASLNATHSVLVVFCVLSWFTCSHVVFANNLSSPYSRQVQQMYIAYYGRPGDPGGIEYWAGRLADAGGNWIADLINAFGTSPEYTDRFRNFSSEELIDNLFQQLYNRTADSIGRDFYRGLLDAGSSTLAEIALDIANGAVSQDRITLDNKLLVAEYFTNCIIETGRRYEDIPLAISVLELVTSSSDSIMAGFIAADHFCDSTSASIVGGWGDGYDGSEDDYVSLTFYQNGVYIHFENDSDPDCPTGGEVGRYAHDGEVLEIVSVVFDDNGDCGLSQGGTLPAYQATVSNDVLFVCESGECWEFERVLFPEKIVGSWGPGYVETEDDYVSLTFYQNGVYIHFENDSDPDCPTGGEVGRYVHDGEVLEIISVEFDNNGDCGLSQGGTLPAYEATVFNDVLSICERGECWDFERVQ